MWLIINKYYPKLKKQKFKLHEPAKVTKNTQDYKAESDVYLEFLSDSIQITNDNNDKEFIEMVYSMFKEWYSSSYSTKPPPKKDFIKYLKNNKYKVDKQKIYGVKHILNEQMF